MFQKCCANWTLLSVLMLCGCSGEGIPELGRVSGTVTLDGSPVEGLQVIFQPEKGRRSVGVTDVHGEYKLDYLKDAPGAVLGTHTVSITFTGEEAGAEEGSGDASSDTPEKNLEAVVIPPQYNSKSTLTAEVKSGENKHDFPLTSK